MTSPNASPPKPSLTAIQSGGDGVAEVPAEKAETATTPEQTIQVDESSPKQKKETTALSRRLQAIRERLAAGREENIQAVNDELTRGEKSEQEQAPKVNSAKRVRRRTADPSIDEADGEEDDEQLRAMKRRARYVPVSAEGAEPDAAPPASVTYGGAGDVDDKAVGRMVAELEAVQKRRERYGRRRAVNDDSGAITFINEGNRLFNRTLDRHYDKFEAVQKIKDDLERGSA